MKRSLLIHIYIAIFFFCLPSANAQVTQQQKTAATDSVRVSLLTCAAGGEIYSLFGHTAIRYENYTRGIDAVFNYGMFNFNAPNFIFRFALGETDYQLGVTDYEHFAAEYNYLGRDVWQQTLNLTEEEKERLIALLTENYRPENRVYRYNFFYDNCATRPRDQIERAINGTLQYADNMTANSTGISFRDLLHKYSEGHLWSHFNKAQIVDKEGQTRPLVAKEEKIVITGKTPADFVSRGITPMQSASLLLILVAGISIYGIRRGKTLWGIDLILFLVAGMAGCILAFLALFSQHPAVSPNYILFVFHPFHLFCLPFMLSRVRKREISRYMLVNFAVLTLFIGLWTIIPQRIPPAVLPLALCLLIRSASNLILTYKRK